MLTQPQTDEYADYYQPYLDLVHEQDLLQGLEDQIAEFKTSFLRVPMDQVDVTHAPYTWTVKQVLGHVVDNERVFGYRAFRFAMGDQTELPGYDQESYIHNSDFSLVAFEELVTELEHVRRGNMALLQRLPDSAYELRGTCDGKQVSVRAIASLLIGHLRHHQNIIEKRLAPKT